MKKTLILFFALFVSISNAQTNIPGTRVTIDIPAGFAVSKSFTGIEYGQSTAIQIYDLTGGSYYTNAATFSKDEFKKLGATVFDYNENPVNGYPAKYVCLQSDPQSMSASVVFGDSTFCVMAMGIYDAKDSEAERKVKEALLSIKYDKNIKPDPLAALAFTLDDSKNKFKYVKGNAGVLLYALNGTEKKAYVDEPIVTVTSLPASDNPKAIADLMLESLTKYGFTDKKLVAESTDKVNGYDAYEIDFTGMFNSKPSHFYILSVMNGENAVAIQLIDKSGTDLYLPEVKKLGRTIKFK